MTSRTKLPLILIGSGPGIGSNVASVFAAKRFDSVALIARDSERLKQDRHFVEEAAPSATVRTYAVDITDSEKFVSVLNQISTEFGPPECVYFNAARVIPSELFKFTNDELVYDFKITCTALHDAANWALPHLLKLANSGDKSVRPSLLVTSSLLPIDPIPQLFALSATKASQKNMVQSLSKIYTPQGVHIGLVVVGGPVDPNSANLNPANIAERAWEFFEGANWWDEKKFEVEIEP